MGIRGLTHDAEGNVRIRRTVTVKVAIGLPPDGPKGHPKRLDHFVFLRKQQVGNEIKWVQDPDLTEHFKKQAQGEPCREVWVTFLDDDPEKVFKTEYAAYVARGKWCSGDGKQAYRRDLGKDGKGWSAPKPFSPCENDGCPEVDRGACFPVGSLYFMLSAFPALGTICRLDTRSYQSVWQISSALQDLARITGGRLTGTQAKLFMAPEKNAYTDDHGARKTNTKWVLGIELAAADLPKLTDRLLEGMRAFQGIRRQLGAGTLEIEEDERDRGADLVGQILPAEQRTEEDLLAEATRLMTERFLNPDQIKARLEKYKGRMPELIERIKTMPVIPAKKDTTDGRTPGPGAPGVLQQPGAGQVGANPETPAAGSSEPVPGHGTRDGRAGDPETEGHREGQEQGPAGGPPTQAQAEEDPLGITDADLQALDQGRAPDDFDQRTPDPGIAPKGLF